MEEDMRLSREKRQTEHCYCTENNDETMWDSASIASFRNIMKERRLLAWSLPSWKSFAIYMNECIYKRPDKRKVKKEVKNVHRT